MPDKTKWVIFAGQLGITTSNYSARGLQKQYWTSTGGDEYYAYYITFESGSTEYHYFTNAGTTHYVRLYGTF